MITETSPLLEYSGTLRKSHKCRQCGKNIGIGERVFVQAFRDEKFYPVKGRMVFKRWLYFHPGCNPIKKENNEAAAAKLREGVKP